MQTLIKTVVLTVLISFCAPIYIGAASAVAASPGSTAAAKARPGTASHKKNQKRASKRDKKKPEKAVSHEL